MTVHFVGAGPGAADLITVRAQRLIEATPVCLYAGSLVPTELLASCPPGARLVDTADLTLDEIIASLVAEHERGNEQELFGEVEVEAQTSCRAKRVVNQAAGDECRHHAHATLEPDQAPHSQLGSEPSCRRPVSAREEQHGGCASDHAVEPRRIRPASAWQGEVGRPFSRSDQVPCDGRLRIAPRPPP